jgi:outer membrane receptor protein involved in Fe transport
VRAAALVSTVLLLVVAGGRRADAQTGTSVVQGVALDAVTRKPVAEAIVTVTSPALQGEQTVLTDSSGFYRVASLPPGQYAVRIDREGYDSYEQGRITVRVDVTFRVNVFLVPRQVEGKIEEIEVTENPPTIDVGSSSVTTTFAEETIRRLPLSRPDGGGGVRSYEAIAATAPQAKGDLFGTSISGTTSPENRYLIDGLAVNDAAYSTGTTPLSSEFVKEVNVVTGGYLPEYGRTTGGIISATLKSGSNEVRGSAWTNVSPGFLEGTRKTVFEEGSTVFAPPARLNLISDFGADLGFPLVKDRLWLYVGALGSTTRNKRTRSLYATQVDAAGMPIEENGHTLRTLIPGTEQTFDVVRNTMQAVGKLSYSPSSNHSLSLTTILTPARSRGVGGSLEGTIERYESVGRNDQLNNIFKWTATALGKRLTFENILGWHRDSGAGLPGDGSLPGARDGRAAQSSIVYRRTRPGYHAITEFENVPNAEAYCDPPGTPRPVRCPVTTYATGGPGYISTTTQDRLQLRSVVTLLAQALGHHVIKVGVDVERVASDLHKAVGGGVGFTETADGSAYTIGGNYGYLVGPDQVRFADSIRGQVTQWGIGAFAQNSWSIADKVTLNLGIRYDSEYLFNNEGRLGMALPNQVAPRVGLIYDPTQSGRSRLFGSVARYYQHVPLDLADRALSAEPGVFGTVNASACDPRDPAKLSACRENSSFRRVGGSADPDQLFRAVGGGTTPIDPSLKTPYVEEYVLGAEYQLLPESRLALTITRRRLNDMIEDMSVDEATTYFIGNPGQGIGASFPAARREYDAMTLVFIKEFLDNWLVQASYTLAKLEGNIAGLYRPETGQLDPNINSDFDLVSLLPNRLGPLGSDNRHQLRLAGAYDVSLAKRHHINIGTVLRATSGAPTNILGSHDIYGPGEVFILPRGSGDRLPWQYGTDLSVRYGVVLSQGHVLEGYVNIFNLLNLQGVTNRDQLYTRSQVLPIRDGSVADLGKLTTTDGKEFDPDDKNPNFGEVTGYQAPRVVTFGLRYNY